MYYLLIPLCVCVKVRMNIIINWEKAQLQNSFLIVNLVKKAGKILLKMKNGY